MYLILVKHQLSYCISVNLITPCILLKHTCTDEKFLKMSTKQTFMKVCTDEQHILSAIEQQETQPLIIAGTLRGREALRCN